MCNKKCEVVFNQYRKLYVIRVTWTRDPLCDIYVHFKHSSLNIWGKGAPFIRPLSFSPFICLDDNRLSWDSQSSLPWLVWPEPWHKTCLFFSDSLPQQGYLTIGVRRGKTPQTSQLRLAFTGLTRENTLCGYMCESSVWLYNKPWYFHLISFLHHG